ncbi:hypothetical protein PoB_006711600 [Plakobranchus ocellatus]|uniref:Uncharacterized protein n=1 Tax=Plakobranchus ocellatus TaxID=259542 RepID=A0AAV4D979_9GAST|nr:hypothetical protein PoB_006711600 [Plakobranchus ocellatus]
MDRGCLEQSNNERNGDPNALNVDKSLNENDYTVLWEEVETVTYETVGDTWGELLKQSCVFKTICINLDEPKLTLPATSYDSDLSNASFSLVLCFGFSRIEQDDLSAIGQSVRPKRHQKASCGILSGLVGCPKAPQCPSRCCP